ncbi:MAG: hypothetical protein JO352_13790 [Chloroflexi bacterium]|nr:hypothetical protein [Chloroflexota bacterium]MBV9602010.1 hypothetical protein [Chloroflexota bacterium]
MPEVLAIVVVVLAVAAGLWLLVSTQNQLRQLRAELDQTQGQLNDTRRHVQELEQRVDELQATVQAAVGQPPPRLPRGRAGGLDDLREQLRASHREDD